MVQIRKRSPRNPAQAARQPGPLDRQLDAAFFRALSDETRVLILACLAKCGREASVGEIAPCCAVDLSVVSRHLAILARAGALEARKEGRTVFYRVRHGELSRRLRALADSLDSCCPGSGPPACCS